MAAMAVAWPLTALSALPSYDKRISAPKQVFLSLARKMFFTTLIQFSRIVEKNQNISVGSLTSDQPFLLESQLSIALPVSPC